MIVLEGFLERLRSDLIDIGADYEIEADVERFAVWVGWKLFKFDPEKVVDDFLLYADQDRGALIGDFDESQDKVTVIACWDEGGRGISQVDDAQAQLLLTLWSDFWNDELTATDAGEVFLLELRDRGVGWDVTNYVVANASFSPNIHSTANRGNLHLVDLGGLRRDYVRMQHPLSVKEPEKLELSLARTRIFKHLATVDGNCAQSSIPTLVCALPLGKIHEWVSEYGNGLFARNLRLRLSGYGKAEVLEKMIGDTITSEPEHMFVQNNGVTITCTRIEPALDSIQLEDVSPEVKIVLHKPQIINGCQTSWAIHSVFENLESQSAPDELPSGFVLAKIIETEDEDLKKKITHSSNRQNAITPRDQRSTDDWQPAVSERLAHWTENLGIFWDYRGGGWEHLLSTDDVWRYLIKGKAYRKLDNRLAGQIVLALAGAVHEAKNQGGKILAIERLYRFAFRYDLPPAERFVELEKPRLRSGGKSPMETYIEDLMFGFAIHQYAVAAFKTLYTYQSSQLKKEPEANRSRLASLSGKEFVKYWAFDVVRLVHLLVEEWVDLGVVKRNEIRENLVGDLTRDRYLNQLFVSHSKRANLFNLERCVDKTSILDVLNPSEELPLLGTWFKNMQETVGARVLKRIVEQEPDVSSFNFILKRTATHEEFQQTLDQLLHSNDSSWMHLFPRS